MKRDASTWKCLYKCALYDQLYVDDVLMQKSNEKGARIHSYFGKVSRSRGN